MKTRFLLTVAGAMVLALAGCSGGSSNSNAPATNTTSSSSSPTVPPEIYAQKKMDLASLNQAVQQYNTTEGHNPASLQDLAPNYIEKIPEAPAGYKFNYDANSGAVSLVQQ
jgi:ABC-type glycerol-3-phosphate transport system substrate-binding protein